MMSLSSSYVIFYRNRPGLFRLAKILCAVVSKMFNNFNIMLQKSCPKLNIRIATSYSITR